jgi:hypothetical protein
MDIFTATAEPNCVEGISMMNINDSSVSNHCGAQQGNSLLDIANTTLTSDPPTGEKITSRDGMNLRPLATHQPAEPVSVTPKVLYGYNISTRNIFDCYLAILHMSSAHALSGHRM